MLNLVSNLNKSHLKVIAELANEAIEIIFVSPFLYDDFNSFFDAIDVKYVENIHLITTLKPNGDDQLRKPNALFSFIDNVRRCAPSADCKIHINNNLHGKIYLFKYKTKSALVLIGSANLTHSGLNNNHEWGTLTDNQSLIIQLKKEITESIEYADLPHELIAGKMRLYADYAMQNTSKTLEPTDINAHLIKLLEDYAVPNIRVRELSLKDAHGIFLKPFGDRKNPVLIKDQDKFGELSKLHFPNPKPKQIKPKDILISFGTGSRAILCIHTSLTGVEEIPKDLQKIDNNAKRWPWFVNAYNHTPKFSDVWWNYNITIDDIAEQYLKQYPQETISYAGGKTLGSFNFGAGHLAISYKFAEFICDSILSIEAELTKE
jgi:hypothetical protein